MTCAVSKALHELESSLPESLTSCGGTSSLSSCLTLALCKIMELSFSTTLGLNIYTPRFATNTCTILPNKIRFWLMTTITKSIRNIIQ